MYIEKKDDGVTGSAGIGRVSFSKTGRSVYYGGRMLHRIKGFKANYADFKTQEEYWISGCKGKGGDRLYPGIVEIDNDVREEYWTDIRKQPENKGQKTIRDLGKYGDFK